ncbi:glyoxalase [Micromonospora globbae]|uniref:Glyoxalase n=2 Tax=Micromonospora globbae TaxID=1894969 RepID=A0A420EVS1_9ACTN|nr:glyoxalase [Micromonospora globbae]
MCYPRFFIRLTPMNTGPEIIPTLRYRDAPAAIRWLVDVIGFRENLVVPGPDGSISHAQLTWGNGMVMLASETDGSDGRMVMQTGPAAVYVVLDDVASHYERVVAAGAEVVQKLRDEDYGGQGYSVRDAEGNLWSFGSYRPSVS